jgi:hypothetical protein
VIACNLSNPQAIALFRLFETKVDPSVRPFIEHCEWLQRDGTETGRQECQRLLKEYHSTKSVPSYAVEAIEVDPVLADREQVSRLLSKKNVSLDDLGKVLPILSGLPSGEHELWEKFFGAFPVSVPTEFLLKSWLAWATRHPLHEIREEDEKYWVAAMRACLNRINSFEGDLAVVIDYFLVGPGMQIFPHLGANCAQFASCYLEVGIRACWNGTVAKNKQKLATLQALLISEVLKATIGDPRLLISSELSIQLALLFARQPEDYPYTIGHEWFMTLMMVIDLTGTYGSTDNDLLFTTYCKRPYAPRGPAAALAVFQWIEKSWAELKSKISWGQGCALVRTLCHFTSSAEAQPPCDIPPRTIYSMWSELALGTWAKKSPISEEMIRERFGIPSHIPVETMNEAKPRPPAAFVEATLDVLDHLMKRVAEPELRFTFLTSMDRDFTGYIIKNMLVGHECLSQFQLRWCMHAFAQFPSPSSIEGGKIIVKAMKSLKNAVLFMQLRWDQNSALTIKSFVEATAQLVRFRQTDEDWLPRLSEVISSLADVPAIVAEENQAEDYGLEALLMKLCESVEETPQDVRKRTAEFVLEVFMGFIRPSKRGEQQKSISTLASEIFISLFLPIEELDCLDSQLWESAFSRLPHEMIQRGLLDLTRQSKLVPWFGLAAPRLIRWAKPESYVSLLELEEACLDLVGNYLVRDDVKDEFQTHVEWILAISALMGKYNDFSDLKDFTANLEGLKFLKTSLTQKLTSRVLSLISDEESYQRYSHFLNKIARTDPDVDAALSAAIIIRDGLPPEVSKKLQLLKTMLIRKAQ